MQTVPPWYRKPTFSGRYVNYFFSHPLNYKISVFNSLVDRAVLLSDDRFHLKNIDTVRNILRNNCYPAVFVNRHIAKRLKLIQHRLNHVIDVVPCENKMLTIPYVKGLSESFGRFFKRFNVDVIFPIPKKLDRIIKRGKDKLTTKEQTGVVYKLNCLDCNLSYIGQTKTHVITRTNEHKTAVKKRDSLHSVVSKHRTINNHEFDWDNVEILHRELHDRKRAVTEMFFIKRESNNINLQADTDNWPCIYDMFLKNA
ncbi:uncharacterized protein LOC109610764 [Ooceraea biroi]|uniref:uncharacterized protein LOC109610764 n=1 Tax=Ooceraea biroi TaxID=2015173 RepID=UPI000F086B4F|nr:uncharacterized protein LOC109610764 [Ooceraea biroi]